MRKLALIAAAALVLAAAPVTAQEESEVVPTEPCEENEEYNTLGIEGAAEDVSPSPVIAFPYDLVNEVQPTTYNEQAVTRYLYRVDVSGSEEVPDAATGNISLTLDWDNDGDYDLHVYDAEGNKLGESVNFNPQAGAGESIILPRTAHCTDIRVDIVNYLAPGPLTNMTLTLGVSGLRP